MHWWWVKLVEGYFLVESRQGLLQLWFMDPFYTIFPYSFSRWKFTHQPSTFSLFLFHTNMEHIIWRISFLAHLNYINKNTIASMVKVSLVPSILVWMGTNSVSLFSRRRCTPCEIRKLKLIRQGLWLLSSSRKSRWKGPIHMVYILNLSMPITSFLILIASTTKNFFLNSY